jgi:hypothetical protein
LPGSISTNGRGVSQGLCHFVSNFTANVPPPACTAGIEETMNISSLLVYPNPADEFIFINENLNATHLKIYNMLGKLIMEQKISASKNNINVSQLKNGMYIIQIIKNEQTLSSVKLIIYHN